MLKIVPKYASNFCSGFPLLSLVEFRQCTMYIHGRLLEQVTGNPEQTHIRKQLDGFSQLVSDFIEASRNFIFRFNSQKDSQTL
jgi:hypothetical protein